jgi:hypothetical protein
MYYLKEELWPRDRREVLWAEESGGALPRGHLPARAAPTPETI